MTGSYALRAEATSADQPSRLPPTGVDVDEGARAVDAIRLLLLQLLVEVVAAVGFGSCFSAPGLRKDMEEPVLVSGTDGVGTKLARAQLLNRHNTVGEDLVAMRVDDVVPAEPLFFWIT